MKQNISFLLVFMAFYGMLFPQAPKYNEVFLVKNTKPKNQARAGTCWSFSTTSFVESEVLRKTNEEFDLSDNFAVYYSYINKAILYVRLNGNNTFSQGGQAHDVLDVIREYGMVTEKAYPYKSKDHSKLEKELKEYLDKIISEKITPLNWLIGYKEILDRELGVPPTTFEYNKKEYTPLQFVKEVLQFSCDDYVELSSFIHHPPFSEFILEVPDNWSKADYYNVPIDDMIKIFNYALENEYSIVWDGDVSEDGFSKEKADIVGDKSVVTDDIDVLRLSLFDQKITTDDHLMHLVGLSTDQNGNEFYLIKNSWGEYEPYKGYLYMSKKYIKLKTVAILLNKNAIPNDIKQRLRINR